MADTTTNNNALCTNMGDLIKKMITDKFAQALFSIIPTTIKDLSHSKLDNITIDTSNSVIKSTITGSTNEQDTTKHDNKNKSTSDDDTDPMVSLSQTATDPSKEAQSESESDKETEAEQLAWNKKKSETLTKMALMQRCKFVQQKVKKEVNFEGIPDNPGETRHQE
eukprot:1042299-Ditylum_brightwellii.AAC.1